MNSEILIKFLFLLLLLNASSCKKATVLDEVKSEVISIDNEFKFEKTKELSREADSLKVIGKIDEALNLYDQALNLEPENPFILNNKGLAASRINIEKGIKIINQAIQIDSTHSHFYNNRGLMNYKLKRNKFAKNDFLKSIELNPKNTPSHINLGLTYHFLKMPSKSCLALKEGIRLGFDITSDEFTKKVFNLNNCD